MSIRRRIRLLSPLTGPSNRKRLGYGASVIGRSICINRTRALRHGTHVEELKVLKKQAKSRYPKQLAGLIEGRSVIQHNFFAHCQHAVAKQSARLEAHRLRRYARRVPSPNFTNIGCGKLSVQRAQARKCAESLAERGGGRSSGAGFRPVRGNLNGGCPAPLYWHSIAVPDPAATGPNPVARCVVCRPVEKQAGTEMVVAVMPVMGFRGGGRSSGQTKRTDGRKGKA